MAMDAFDLAERLQTIVFVMSDLDLGMNTWMSPAVHVSGQAARSRQGARRGRSCGSSAASWGRYKDVDGDGDSVAHRAGHRRAGVLHARLRPQRDGAVHRAARRLRQATSIGSRASSTRRRRSCPQPVVEIDAGGDGRHHRVRLEPLGGRGIARPAARGSRLADVVSAAARLSVHAGGRRLHPAATTASTSSSRTATRQMLSLLLHGRRCRDLRRASAQRAALQRPADRRPQHHRRHPGAGEELRSRR